MGYIRIGVYKVSQNEKKIMYGFPNSKNMINFEAFPANISSSIILILLKSGYDERFFLVPQFWQKSTSYKWQ